MLRSMPVMIRATFAARETPHASKALVVSSTLKWYLSTDWINCMRHFSVSHYFAELDVMHMPLTFEHGLSFIAALTKKCVAIRN